MEEKAKEIQNYLSTKANPVIQPMLQQMAKQRPKNVLPWMQSYINKQMSNYEITPDQQCQIQADGSSDDEVDQAQFRRKMERVKKNGNKKVSRMGISSQVYGIFNQKAQFKPQVIQKGGQTEKQIQKLLQGSILFQSLNPQDMQSVVKATQLNQVQKGQTVISEGQLGDALYIVSSGQYDCFKVINGKETFLKTYLTGQAFGQLSLMYNAPRAATIKCTHDGLLFKLDRQTFRNIVQEAAIKKRAYYGKILARVDILSDMDVYERDQICDALKQESFEPDAYVLKQGQTGDRFYIIAEGELTAYKKQGNQPIKKVFQYKAGQYFGEIALIKNTVRQASIKTLTPCTLVWIDRDAFKRLLGPLQGILSRNMEKYKKIIDQ